MEPGFAVRTAGLSFVSLDKLDHFAFVDEDLTQVGALRKLLPSKAEYLRSHLCRGCELYLIDYGTRLDRKQAEEVARRPLPES